jgi:hypothetical protein
MPWSVFKRVIKWHSRVDDSFFKPSGSTQTTEPSALKRKIEDEKKKATAKAADNTANKKKAK